MREEEEMQWRSRGCRAHAHLHGVLHLEQAALRGEGGRPSIVPGSHLERGVCDTTTAGSEQARTRPVFIFRGSQNKQQSIYDHALKCSVSMLEVLHAVDLDADEIQNLDFHPRIRTHSLVDSLDLNYMHQTWILSRSSDDQ
jgi:hypothetical protein